jgi:hypothetical protein
MILVLIVAMLLMGDSPGATRRAERQDLVSIRQMSLRERSAMSRAIGEFQIAPQPLGRSAEISSLPDPFAGFLCGYTVDNGQQVLSRHPEVTALGDSLSLVHFGWIGYWAGEWCWGTAAKYNAWDPSTRAFIHGVDGCYLPPSPDNLPEHATIALGDPQSLVIGYAETKRVFQSGTVCSTTENLYQSYMTRANTSGTCFFTIPDSILSPPQTHGVSPKILGAVDVFRRIRSSDGGTCRAYHVGTRDLDRGYLFYHRFDPCTKQWSSPVLMDSVPSPSHFLLSYPAAGRAIFAFCRPRDFATGSTIDNDLVYYESADDGLSWAGGTVGTLHNVTSFTNSDLERAYGDAGGAFTSDGRLHLVWVSTFYDDSTGETSDSRCKVRHWAESMPGANGPIGLLFTSVIRAADWIPAGIPGVFNRDICNLSVGVGDGSLPCPAGPGGTNLDYLYVLYTQYGGEDSLDIKDLSSEGFQNGNLYFIASPNGGAFWSKPTCLTATDSVGGTPTRSPGCIPWFYPGCLSEHWGTIAPEVGAVANVAFVADLAAGNNSMGEGSRTGNSFRYLRMSGSSASVLCPELKCRAENACGVPGDLTQDGTVDVFDVVASIDITFAGQPPIPSPPGCPWDLSDVNCDGTTDVFDVIALIDYVFQGGATPPNPCGCHAG